MNAMTITKTNGIDGEYVKVTITIGDKTYTRNTRPNGSNQYANVTNGRTTSMRAGGATANMIDKAIAAAQQ